MGLEYHIESCNGHFNGNELSNVGVSAPQEIGQSADRRDRKAAGYLLGYECMRRTIIRDEGAMAMNFQWTRTATPICLAIMVVAIAIVISPSPAVAQTFANDNPLSAFVGTWTAKAPGENTPYLFLNFQDNRGKLEGTTTHFKMKVTGKGMVIGNPEGIGESPLGKLTVGGAELSFEWTGDSRFQALKAKFTLQGTRQASLIFGLSPEKQQQIMKENPGASGFHPVISLRREAEASSDTPTPSWEAGFMAKLINTAEAQYKFAKGSYADYPTLVRSGQLEETDGREFTMLPQHFRSETDPLPGYRVRLLLSPDASSYQLSIQETTSDCGIGVFTDETGIILQGHASDCPK